jgi:hypothetical protein
MVLTSFTTPETNNIIGGQAIIGNMKLISLWSSYWSQYEMIVGGQATGQI